MRAMLWRGLWDAVRDARLPLSQFADILVANAGAERDTVVLQEVLDLMVSARAYFYLFGDQATSSAGDYGRKFEELAWSGLTSESRDRDSRTIWLDHFIQLAHSPEALSRLASLLGTGEPVPGLTLDQDRRWAVLRQLSAQGYGSAADLAAKEAARDTSGAGHQAYIAVQAARPDPREKQKWLDRFNHGSKLVFADLRVAIRTLLPMNRVP